MTQDINLIYLHSLLFDQEEHKTAGQERHTECDVEGKRESTWVFETSWHLVFCLNKDGGNKSNSLNFASLLNHKMQNVQV